MPNDQEDVFPFLKIPCFKDFPILKIPGFNDSPFPVPRSPFLIPHSHFPFPFPHSPFLLLKIAFPNYCVLHPTNKGCFYNSSCVILGKIQATAYTGNCFHLPKNN